MTDAAIPEDIMKSAEEALDNMLCNCKESCGGTYDGVRAESIKDIASAILAERERSSDLLEAAQSLIACLDLIDEKHWCQYDHVTSVALQDARAAIAKAEGRSA